MRSKFIVVAPSRPTEFMEQMEKRIGNNELLYHEKLGRAFKNLGGDTSYVGAIVVEMDGTSLSGAKKVVDSLLRKEPRMLVLVALRDTRKLARAFQHFKELADIVTILCTQDPEVVAEAIFACLQKRSTRLQSRAIDINRRWRAVALTFSRALQLRDRVTQLHSVGVMQICRLVSENLPQSVRLPKPLAFQLMIGALLHDAGKLAIPPAILQKPEKLTSDEWKKVEAHPEEGLRDVLSLVDFTTLLPKQLKQPRSLEALLRYLVWPLLVLTHHWRPRYQNAWREPYPTEINYPECKQYLAVLGWSPDEPLDDFFPALFDKELIPEIATGEQLRILWAIIRCADVIDARLFPRPYHTPGPAPSLAQVLYDLESEAGEIAKSAPKFKSALEAVGTTLRTQMTAVTNCLNNRGMDWMERESLGTGD